MEHVPAETACKIFGLIIVQTAGVVEVNLTAYEPPALLDALRV